jgi:hypothetical protein
MRIGLVAIATALSVLGSILLSPASADLGGAGDEATGSGANQFLIAVGEARLSVSAHSGPLGESPSGAVRAQGEPDGAGPTEPFKLEGEVTCLRVSGNRAAIKYAFQHAEGSAEPFQDGGVQIFLEDNGDPARGVAVDRSTFDPPQAAPAFDLDASRCDDPGTRVGYDQIESGNFRVDDATP